MGRQTSSFALHLAMEHEKSINRRDFLKLLKANLMALALLPDLQKFIEQTDKGFVLSLDQVPKAVRSVLGRVTRAEVDEGGYLILLAPDGRPLGKAPLATTFWNFEHHSPYDRLDPRFSWGIVLHWYGDKNGFDNSITGYLRGFDSLRDIEGEFIRTSAHFLVGAYEPSVLPDELGKSIGIVQTQAPDLDGTPFVASHLRPLNYQVHRDKGQYFVRALYQLGYTEPKVHSLLQDMFDGPRVDPNMRTIAVEITGCDFDTPSGFPSEQKIANVISVVWALMKRYQIPASHLLGHNEIQLGKADPGKKFLALVRYLLGVKALVDGDLEMKRLIFGQYLDESGDFRLAAVKYFEFVRGYLALISFPRTVYEWEKLCGYGRLYEVLCGCVWGAGFADRCIWPMVGGISNQGDKFLEPENHEGIHISCSEGDSNASQTVNLVAGGECIFTGENASNHPGKTAIFRHLLPDGAEFNTVYSHLDSLVDLQIGKFYPRAYPIGAIGGECLPAFLHFAVAYGATWLTDLKSNPNVPTNAGMTWIRYRYLDPVEFITGHAEAEDGALTTKGASKNSESKVKVALY